MLKFHIYDVFTDTPFTGNPLAIVEGADALSLAQMQTIARQFNLSETMFIQTPEDSAHAAKVRIFTPANELPFAGHPTIGCALHLAGDEIDMIILEEGAGLVPVTITRTNGAPLAEFTAPKLPVAHAECPDIAALAAATGLDPSQIGPDKGGVFQGGPDFLYIPVIDLDALAQARPMEPQWSATLDTANVHAAYLYTQAEDCIRARMFAPLGGIMEDPATGSATAIFAAQLNTNGALPGTGTTTIQLKQGVEMGRPSDLRLSIDTNEGDITAIRVAGSAVKIAEGQIRIPQG